MTIDEAHELKEGDALIGGVSHTVWTIKRIKRFKSRPERIILELVKGQYGKLRINEQNLYAFERQP